MKPSSDTRIHVDEQQLLVIFNPVRSTRRADFIKFVNDVLFPAVDSLNPALRCTTHLLEPNVSNADGSYTYVMVIDPAFHTQDPPVRAILNRAYGVEASREHLECYLDYLTDTRSQSVLADKDTIEPSF